MSRIIGDLQLVLYGFEYNKKVYDLREFTRSLDIILLEYLLQEARTFAYICMLWKFKDCPTNLTIYYTHTHTIIFCSFDHTGFYKLVDTKLST